MLMLLFLLITKHFVVDFLLQNSWMAFNKHNPLKLGGYAHAGLHGLATLVILWGYPEFFLVALLETVAHFLIDCGKMNFNRAMKWHPKTNAFWMLLGFDQYLHYCTYLLIVMYYFGE